MTEAINARETSTSALMSKAVMRPIMASRIIGMPQSIMAIQAMLKENGEKPSMLERSAIPESTRNRMSLLIPPDSSSFSNLFTCNPPVLQKTQTVFSDICGVPKYTNTPIGILYTHKGIRCQEMK